MSDSRTRFYLDKQDAKWMGVCSGIADYTGIDTTIVRIGMLMLFFVTGGWMLLAYVLTGWIAPKRPVDLYQSEDQAKFWQGVRSNPKRTTAEVRSKFRELDRRLADIETYYTSQPTQLANEIERLR